MLPLLPSPESSGVAKELATVFCYAGESKVCCQNGVRKV